MCSLDLPDMYVLSPWACGPWASGIHIRQIPHAHVTTITNTMKYTKSTYERFASLMFVISCHNMYPILQSPIPAYIYNNANAEVFSWVKISLYL